LATGKTELRKEQPFQWTVATKCIQMLYRVASRLSNIFSLKERNIRRKWLFFHDYLGLNSDRQAPVRWIW
jgi:hypothetical protein